MTRRLLAPMLAIVFCTAWVEPWPISVMAITAATPMTMPSVVRAERKTLRRMAVVAMPKVRGKSRNTSRRRGCASCRTTAGGRRGLSQDGGRGGRRRAIAVATPRSCSFGLQATPIPRSNPIGCQRNGRRPTRIIFACPAVFAGGGRAARGALGQEPRQCVVVDEAVADVDDSVGVASDVQIVSHQYDGDSFFLLSR